MRATLFGALIIATMVSRLVLLESGPEIDPDAYAHAMAGRRLLEGAEGVAMHWVWLPLWHWLHALAARYAHGIDTMRACNVALSSAAPVLLVAVLRPCAPRALAWLAGAFLALMPTHLVHGASSQLEPPVLTLTLAACLAWERAERHPLVGIAGGLALASAALIRYEAWAALLSLMLLWARTRDSRRLAVWALPLVAVAAWCVHHRLVTGEWLQFLRYNADFAQGYLSGVGYPWGAEPNRALAVLWYVTAVPWIELAVLAPLLLLGASWLARSAPRSLLAAELAMLAFLAVGFAAGQHLGLARHGLVIAPLYAACAAAGLVRLGERLHARWPLRMGLLALVVLRSVPGYARGLERHRTAYRDELSSARVLRRVVGAHDGIFCDRGSVEVLSELPPTRFRRWPLRDVQPFHLQRAAGECGRALIVSDSASTAHLHELTEPLHQSGPLRVLAYPRLRSATPCEPSTHR